MTPTLPWSDALALDLPAMDDTHREFVDLLATAEAAPDGALAAAWDELVDHTEAHFAQEDAWMRATRFAAGNCHSLQHRVVLQVLREGAILVHQGDPAPVRQMIHELAVWFPHHAATMDATLAQHLQNVGFDTGTLNVLVPQALPVEEIHGCGGACSH